MNFVKKAAKVLVIGIAVFTMIRPMSSTIPKLPPIQMLGQVTETVHLS